MPVVYASCVRFEEAGLLICGGSGSGKSDLCLRLADAGGSLVADDQTVVENRNGRLIASCPERLRGLLEVRGIGIVETPFVPETEINLKLVLRNTGEIERMPASESENVEGVPIPVFRLDPFEVSAIVKIKTFLSVLNGQRKVVL